MADPTTTNIQLAVPNHGSHTDDWDVPVNNNSTILDAAFGSRTTKSLTNANVTLTATESQVNIIRFIGTLTGNLVVTLGAISKTWTVQNRTTGNFTITLQGSGGTGNVVGVRPGSSQFSWDGTDVEYVNLGQLGEYWDDTGAAVQSWVTACTIPPALLCDGSTFSAITYPQLNQKLGGNTLPDARGSARFALNGGTGRLTSAGGIDGNTRFARGGDGDGLVIGTSNLPPYTPSGTNSAPTITTTINNGSNIISGASGSSFGGGPVGAGVTITATSTSSAPAFTGTAQGGTSAPLASVPPGYVGGVTLIWAV